MFQEFLHEGNKNIDENVKNLMKNVFWRSTKRSEVVRDQMDIPELLEFENPLHFNPIEVACYERLFDKTRNSYTRANRFGSDVGSRSYSGYNQRQKREVSERSKILRAWRCHDPGLDRP